MRPVPVHQGEAAPGPGVAARVGRVADARSRCLTFIGGGSPGGSYVLRIRISRPMAVVFGRFKGGKAIALEAGDYAYVGSALAEAGATCLARRLVRHATRLDGRPPHPIRALMLAEFPRAGLCPAGLQPPAGKRPKWNVDHLLDLPCAELVGAYLVRSPARIEPALGKLLEDDPATVVFERGLGANDVPGNTHLLRVDAGERWWHQLPQKLTSLLPVDRQRRGGAPATTAVAGVAGCGRPGRRRRRRRAQEAGVMQKPAFDGVGNRGRGASRKRVAAHGRRAVDATAAGHTGLSECQLVTLSNLHADRSGYILGRMAAGVSFTRANRESKELGVYDTNGWGEVASRLWRGRGTVMCSAAAVAAHGDKIIRTDEQRLFVASRARELKAGAERLRVLVAQMSPPTPGILSPAADGRLPAKQPPLAPVRFTHLAGWLKQCVAFIAKNERDVPLIPSKVGAEPTLGEQACISSELARIRSGADLLLQACAASAAGQAGGGRGRTAGGR